MVDTNISDIVLERQYEIVITNPDGELITIASPFTAKISVKRSTLADANRAKVVIHNLGSTTRGKVFKDQYTFNEQWIIGIKAGYEEKKLIFFGYVQQAYSYKEGTEWMTSIEAFDGLYPTQNSHIAKTFPKGSSFRDIIIQAVSGMIGGIKTGNLSGVNDKKTKRGVVGLGKAVELIHVLTGGTYFIDQNILHAINDDDYLGEEVLDLGSGLLLGTPRRRDIMLICKTIFFPEATVASAVRLTSKHQEYSGLYKIMSIQHEIEISGSSSGTGITTLGLNAGAKALRKAVDG